MADARDEKVWTNHADEQMVTNKFPHAIGENDKMRGWLLDRKDEVTKVLDFGCGGGLWRDLFRGFDYLGVDQNKNMIDRAIERGVNKECHFQQIEWNQLPFEDASFDMVFTAAVLQHNKHPDKQPVLAEFARVIKPGGFLMCTENTFRNDNYRSTFGAFIPWTETLDDGYSFTQMGWKKLIESFGFELVIFDEPSEYLFRRV